MVIACVQKYSYNISERACTQYRFGLVGCNFRNSQFIHIFQGDFTGTGECSNPERYWLMEAMVEPHQFSFYKHELIKIVAWISNSIYSLYRM